MYLIQDWNHESLLRKDFYVFSFQWPECQGDVDTRLKSLRARFEAKTWFNDYGMCDSPEQFLAHEEYGQLLQKLPEQYIVAFQHFDAVQNAGFRWHKHGPYIGVHQPSHEHFGLEYDPDIKEVYSFHIYRKR